MNKLYCVSDLHGNGAIWDKIKNKLDDTDTLYFLGDATDRGPDGWRILKDIVNDERIFYVMGNHDMMLRERLKDRSWGSDVAWTHDMNGGGDTWMAALEDSEENVMNVYRYLSYSTLWSLVIVNRNNKFILLNHSGTESKTPDDRTDIYDDYVWSRDLGPKVENNGIDYVIHGHTPLNYVDRYVYHKDIEWEPWDGEIRPYEYTPNKFCIDAGTAFTDKAILMDLDTFEYEVIEGC